FSRSAIRAASVAALCAAARCSFSKCASSRRRRTCLRTKTQLKSKSRMTNRMTPPTTSQITGTEIFPIWTSALLELEVLPEGWLFVVGLAAPLPLVGGPLVVVAANDFRLEKAVGARHCELAFCACWKSAFATSHFPPYYSVTARSR